MKQLDFLEMINDIDAELLEERPAEKKTGGGRLIRRIVLAAAAVLLLCGSVYAVVSRIEMKKISRPTGEQGVEAKVELPLVKWSSFEGGIKTAGETIAHQYETFTPEPDWSSVRRDPGQYKQSFESVAEAIAYIGLDGLKTPAFPYEDYMCSVTAHGDENGKVDQVQLTLEHVVPDEITVWERATLLTEYAQDGEYVSAGFWTYEFPRDVEFQIYRTPGGNECRVAVLRPQYESDFIGLTGYLAAGPAFCELNLGAVPKDEYDRALEILHAWADALD